MSIFDPTQMRINLNLRQSPAAFPSEFIVQTENNMDVNIMGGLTKLEYAAIHLAAGYPTDVTPAEVVERAADILDAVAKYGQPKADPPPLPEAKDLVSTESAN